MKKLKVSAKRFERIVVFVNKEELKTITKKAKDAGHLQMSPYVRKVLLNESN